MAISVFDLFSIGIGPSSSHTVGPMRAARMFAESLEASGRVADVAGVEIHLHGSLGATGRGHGSDKAVIAGLQGARPESVDPEWCERELQRVAEQKTLQLLDRQPVPFDMARHLKFINKCLPLHPNGMKFRAWDTNQATIRESVYYSVGGGFVVDESAEGTDRIVPDSTPIPHPFTTGAQLLRQAAETGYSISTLMMENEKAWRDEAEIRASLLEIWSVMQQCVRRGCSKEGILPGGLKVRRRAAPLYRKLMAESHESSGHHLSSMDWVNLWALAVNEENAAGGRVVTAPTNGAAGIIPAVLHYYHRFCGGADDEGTIRFLLTAGAIGILYKINASISGAEVGCQGEVGSACSMAAAGLTEVLGGTPLQVENAAEIGMEHNLGLTCDPIGGLVQVPCIERNAMGAVKAINAARLALRGDGQHYVSLDKVIRTMRETGRDMKSKYKETARGGLAVNVIEC